MSIDRLAIRPAPPASSLGPGAAILIASVVACASCAEPAGSRPALSVQDSAGVALIDNAAPSWDAEAAWRIPEAPVLTLGVAEGAPELEFQSILGLTRLPNGNIVIGNRGTRELRFFGPDGAFIRAVGRDGEGPGEFRTFLGVYPYRADSLVVWDYRLLRWSVFDTAGTLARIIRPERPGLNPRSLAPLEDGSLIISDRSFENAGTRTLESEQFFRFAPDGALLDSLGGYPSGESFSPSNGAAIAMGRIFGASLVRASAPDGYVIGLADAYEIRSYDRDGSFRRRIRWDGPSRDVTAADIEAYRRDFIARQGDSDLGKQFARLVEEVPAAERFPTYSQLVRDRAGNVWLAAYPRPGRSGPRPWTVIGADGQWLGDVALPDGLEVWDIGEDWVLGVMDDELGVEQVRLYAIERTGSAR